MRSSKSRSRGNNKTRSVRPTGGNIINRVFDSSGPDGKVRGTPQQIIEKYTQLHRDAQLSNDRVNAENFAQHAEHYTRLLAEAMREVDRAREEQEQFNRERQVERDQQIQRQNDRQGDRQISDRQPSDRQPSDRQPSDRQLSDRERQSERDRERAARLRAQEDASGDPALMDQPYISDRVYAPDSRTDTGASDAPDTGLVDTPEEVRRPVPTNFAADAPRGDRPVRVDRGPRPDRQPDRQPDQRAPRPERQPERQQDRGPRPSPVAALLAEVEQPRLDPSPAPDAAVAAAAAPKPVRARKPKPKPEVVTDGPAEAAE